MSKREQIVCWFSCGAASAAATKLALDRYGDSVVMIGYQDTGSEHPDNKRFLADCQEWYGREITAMRSEKYADIWDVFQRTRYLVGVGGARCTAELKRKVAEDWLAANGWGMREVFGYTADEQRRVARFQAHNTDRNIYPILIEHGMAKSDCLSMVQQAGIALPEMYRLGYSNNNCIGCVKGQAGYWNKIRRDFPGVFARMAKVERELNVAINKTYIDGKRTRVFLDELPEDMGSMDDEPPIQCGLFCSTEQE